MFLPDKSLLTRKKKKDLRAQILHQRDHLSVSQYNQKSIRICEHLWLYPLFVKAKTVLFFAPHKNEPNIAPIIERCFEKKKVCFPRVAGNQMHIYEVQSFSDLSPGAFGIFEPKASKKISPKTIDLVLLPAVGIDENGNRLGFGGGFYDRFLSQYPLKTLAVVFQFQRIPLLPVEEFDVPADAVITEWGISEFYGTSIKR